MIFFYGVKKMVEIKKNELVVTVITSVKKKVILKLNMVGLNAMEGSAWAMTLSFKLCGW